MPLVKFVMHSSRGSLYLLKMYSSCPSTAVGDESLLIGAISRDAVFKTALQQTNRIAKRESDRQLADTVVGGSLGTNSADCNDMNRSDQQDNQYRLRQDR